MRVETRDAAATQAARNARPPRLTVLIVSWNAWHYLKPCLDSIRASEFGDLEVLVVDNDSRDRTVESLERSFPEVRILRNPVNLGHTRAVNQGFAAARGEFVLVLDSDTETSRDALGLLVGFFDAHPEVDLIAPRTLNSDGTVQESARNFPDAFSGLFGRQSYLAQLFPGNPFTRRYLQRDRLGATEPFRVESVASSCMMLRRSLLDRVGPWDEGYPGYFVETDWCFRLKRAGIQVWCVPAARVVHHENNNRARKRGAKRITMFHTGAFRFYRRNRTFGWLDPRTWFALAALSARALVLIGLDTLKEEPRGPAAPADRREVGAAQEERR